MSAYAVCRLRYITATVILVTFIELSSGTVPDPNDDSLLCRSCGHEVARPEDLFTRPTRHAIRMRNDTILGSEDILIQLLQNPNGVQFEVITTRKADVYKYDKAVSQFSWFDGTAWRVAACPKCGAHLGWTFEPLDHRQGKKDTPHTFVGLILEKLLHKTYADSLLVVPKSYTS